MYWMPIEAYRQYGIASYNAGSAAIDPKTLKIALAEVLKTQSPSLILIDARPFQYGDFENAEYITEVGLRHYTDSVRYSRERLQYIMQLVPSKISPQDNLDIWSYIFDIAKYHMRWTELNELSWHLADGVHKNNNMGYAFLPHVDPSLQEIGCSQITQELEPSKGLQNVLKDLLEYCSKLDAQVLFVTNSYVEMPADRMRYNYIKRVIKQYDNIDYINTNDFNQQIGLDYSMDFADKSHVNAFGAEKYTIFLGQYIKEHYTLPDRRQDEQFHYWDDIIPQWKQTVQENKNFLINQRNQVLGQPPH